jgi:hypothetical protein
VVLRSMMGVGELVERCVPRVRREVPRAVAVFLVGSNVRGEAGPHSDLDFDVLVADEPRGEAPVWFEVDDDRLVCVSVWVRTVAEWIASQEEAQDWTFGLPCVALLRLCWVADDSWRARLERSRLAHPAGEPELEHFIGDLGKVANAHGRGDELGVRLAAQDLARSCPALLQPLNPERPVRTRDAALRRTLDFEVAPGGYRDDLSLCLGVSGRPGSADDVHAAACRLATGIAELLESHAGSFAGLLSRPLLACLADGSLRRYVAQVVARR